MKNGKRIRINSKHKQQIKINNNGINGERILQRYRVKLNLKERKFNVTLCFKYYNPDQTAKLRGAF
jgi:hypothetical protein